VSPGEWLKEAFESRVDAELEWATPDNEVNYYVERASSGVSIDADLYVGLTTEDLVRVDETLDDDLFVERGEVEDSTTCGRGCCSTRSTARFPSTPAT